MQIEVLPVHIFRHQPAAEKRKNVRQKRCRIAIPDRKRILIENTKDLTIAFGTNTKITSEDAWPIRICGSTGVTVTGKNVTIRVEKNVYPAAVSILGSEVTFKYTEMDILVVSSSSEVGSGISGIYIFE